jgi:hypothetical protein
LQDGEEVEAEVCGESKSVAAASPLADRVLRREEAIEVGTLRADEFLQIDEIPEVLGAQSTFAEAVTEFEPEATGRLRQLS